MTQEEYAEMLSQAKDQFKSGTVLFGKDGLYCPNMGMFTSPSPEIDTVSPWQPRTSCVVSIDIYINGL